MEGVEAAHKAMRLNPHHPEWYVVQLGQVYYDARRYKEAIAALESVRSLDMTYMHLYLAASHAALGHVGEAQQAIKRVLELDPQATIKRRTNSEMAPYKSPNDLEHLCKNLRKAGLPEE